MRGLLDILRDAGFEIDSLCETGNCETCRLGIKSGKVQFLIQRSILHEICKITSLDIQRKSRCANT